MPDGILAMRMIYLETIVKTPCLKSPGTRFPY